MNPRKDGVCVSTELDFRMLELNGMEVTKITRVTNSKKKLKVYNFQCSPYNTYLIDNMWVHNCDVIKRKIERSYNMNSMIQLLVGYADLDLIITGGEPFVQPEALGFLINVGLDARKEFGYSTNVVVETNGTIGPEILRRTQYEASRVSEENLKAVVWSINPKLHSSHEEWSKTRFTDFMEFPNVQVRLTVNPFDPDDLSDMRRIASLIPSNVHIVAHPMVQDLESYDIEAYQRSLHELYKIIIDERLARVRIIPQLHKVIWGMRKESI
jgi:organic radical activating enzyme